MFDLIAIALIVIIDLVIIMLCKKCVDEEYDYMNFEEYIGAWLIVLLICLLLVPFVVVIACVVLSGLFNFLGIWLLFIVIAIISATIYVFWTPIKEWVEELEVNK